MSREIGLGSRERARSTSPPAPLPPPSPPHGVRSRARRRRGGAALALGFTLPAWVLTLAVCGVPIAVAAYLSLRSDKLASFIPGRYVGFDNYRNDLGGPEFRNAVENTAILLLLGTVVQLPLGLGLALVLHRNLRGTRAFRSALLIPMLLTPVAVGLMWRFMFDADLGVVNWMLESIGLSRVNWLGARWSAIWAVVIVDSWQSIPFVMLLCLAGLAGLPSGPHEAARVDGASAWQTLRHVTLPMLRPVLFVILTIRFIDAVKTFDTIYILTRGGPGTSTQTVGLLAHNIGFTFLATGRASAVAVALIVFTIPAYLLWRQAAKVTSR